MSADDGKTDSDAEVPGASSSAGAEFERGIIYTVDPRVLAPLQSGEEYRVVASTRFRISKDEIFVTYEPLYRRARRLIERRRAELTCDGSDAQPHTWIVAHGWFRMETPRFVLVGAVVTLGAACGGSAQTSIGQEEPTAEALTTPYVAQLAAAGGAGKPWFDEFYNDFDMRLDQHDSSAVTVSYGEYVPSRDGLDVEALIRRAEHRARFYVEAVEGANAPFRIIRSDWTCLDTGKTAKPLLANVNLLVTV